MVFLRKAVEVDLPLIMAWRSNPLVYKGFYSQKKPLTWEEHIEWWRSRYNWREFIICLKEETDIREIGLVNIGQLDHWSPEIGYFIGEISLWGKGYGKAAVGLACEWLKGIGKQYVHTTILDSNKGSIKLVKGLGFKQGMRARKGETYYTKEL